MRLARCGIILKSLAHSKTARRPKRRSEKFTGEKSANSTPFCLPTWCESPLGPIDPYIRPIIGLIIGPTGPKSEPAANFSKILE